MDVVYGQFRCRNNAQEIRILRKQYTLLTAQYGYCSNICNMIAANAPHFSSRPFAFDAINILWVMVQGYAISVLCAQGSF